MKRFMLDKTLYYRLLALPLAMLPIAVSAQRIEISGTNIVEIELPSSMGYSKAYVLQNAADATVTYHKASAAATVDWQRFSSLGAAFSEPVGNVDTSGQSVSITSPQPLGYAIQETGRAPLYFWIVDYAAMPYAISGLSVDIENSDCNRVMLHVQGTAPEMLCYSINGRPYTISREISMRYNTLVYNADDVDYRQVETSADFEYASSSISATAPLCDTRFTLVSDRFTKAWGLETEVTSESYTTTSVAAETVAEQTVEKADNEQSTELPDGAFGGSAPCDITFRAALSDAAIYHRWEMAHSSDFIDVFYTDDRAEFSYTFTEAGTTYVRLVADNAAATCPYEGEIYTINIGESRLECPNAFAPGRDGGDEWRVSYKSIVDFHCEIFNRWGKKLAEFNHPSQGWDGIIGGKPAPSGVYFYVITATGADGKEYKLSGDINVILSRKNTNTGTTTE